MAEIIPFVAAVIFIVAAVVIIRSFLGFGRHQRTINEVFQAALRKQEAALRKQESDADEPTADITCQFCGGKSDQSRERCKNCGAPLN